MVICFSLSDGRLWDYNQKLSTEALLAFQKSYDSVSMKKDTKNDKLIISEDYNVEFKYPNCYRENDMEERNMLISIECISKNRAIEVVYSDDDSFKILTNEDYANAMDTTRFISSVRAVYEDVSINIWEPRFITKLGSMFYCVYTGKSVADGIRQSSTVAQFIKGGKLYTIKGICRPNDLREFHMDFRDVIDGMTFVPR